MLRPRLWFLRFCSCHCDVMFGRFHDYYCPRHGWPRETDMREYYAR